MAYATISNRRLRAEGSNSEAPVRKVHRGSGSSDELVEEMVVDSAAPSWGQNIQKMMICMMGKIDGTADDILEVKTLANKRQERGRRSQHRGQPSTCGSRHHQEEHQRTAGQTSQRRRTKL